MALVSLKGRLVVATPALPDPNFDRTVVLLLAHSEEGAAGVVLNRPSEMHVSEPLPKWDRLAADPPVVFVGGPVGPGGAICLAQSKPGLTSDQQAVGWTPLDSTSSAPSTSSRIPMTSAVGSRPSGSSPDTPVGVPASSSGRSRRAPGS